MKQGASSGDSIINTSASNIIIAGGGTIASANAYNMSFISNQGGFDSSQGHPPSRGIGMQRPKMMAAVASGIIDETSPHSSKHDLIISSQGAGQGQALYRKRF